MLPDVSRGVYVLQGCLSWQSLNHLMLLKSIRTALMTYINVVDVGNDFVTGNDHRNHVFGTKFNRLINIQFVSMFFCLITQIYAIVYY